MVLSYSVQVICLFHHLDWKIFSFDCDRTFDKQKFLNNVFNRLTRNEIMQLEKLSLCQFCENDEEVFSFIDECNGKIYFDSTNSQDIENNLIKDQYLSSIAI